MKNRCVMVGVALLTGFVAREASADFRPQPLTLGMSQEEVLGAWGAPIEREERETRREATWLYPGRAVVAFSNGRVARWDGGGQARSAIPLSPAMTTAIDSKGSAKQAGSTPAVSETEMQDILDEIVERSGTPAAAAGSPTK